MWMLPGLGAQCWSSFTRLMMLVSTVSAILAGHCDTDLAVRRVSHSRCNCRSCHMSHGLLLILRLFCGCSYFARDNVGLPGFAAFYRASSLEERTHAQQLMNFQVWVALQRYANVCLPSHTSKCPLGMENLHVKSGNEALKQRQCASQTVGFQHPCADLQFVPRERHCV